ncbi:putative proteinC TRANSCRIPTION FACTOR 56 [Salix koriyanagi]|uniref:Uncharacterized protein n=1 Tax=Salix koriyanagi TaxID=2511006 RepID=A0A9Q0YRP6_9ROSI|nr:putative proteinC TRANSCRIPTION FACTOR 56 [Salix koriyanagi]
MRRNRVVLLPPPAAPSSATGTVNDYMYFDTSDSVPRLHTDSSCSEHVVSPEFTCEVQSEPRWKEWGNVNALDNHYNYLDATMDIPFASQLQGGIRCRLSRIYLCTCRSRFEVGMGIEEQSHGNTRLESVSVLVRENSES